MRLGTRSVAIMALLALLAASPSFAQDETPTAPPKRTPTPASILDEHRAQPQATPEAPEQEETPVEGTAEETPAPRKTFDMHLYWERGLNYTVLQRVRIGNEEVFVFDKDATLTGRIGLKLGVDTAGFFEHGDVPPLGTRIEVRRILVYTTGEFRFFYPILFKFDLGGVGDELYFSDFYFWARDVPYVGTVKIGQFDAPMSLEALSGSTNETFLEYGSPVAAFAPGLKVGLQIADHSEDQRATWAVGYFTDGQQPDVGDASDSIARLTGRLTYLPVQAESDADLLIHLGISASYVLSSHDRIRYDSRPESFLAPHLVSTGDLDTNNAFPFGLELAAKRGPLTFQAEYMASAVDAGALGGAYLDGVYGSVGWFLTGEHRAYDATVGQIGGLVPAHDVDPWKHQWGAWEIASRISWLDLSDGEIRGGRMRIVTGGINWYWNRYVRVMFDTSHVDVGDGPNDGHLVILQARFQLVF